MKTVLNINIDKELKAEFTAFAKELGTNPTNLLNMMIVETLRERKVSFGNNSFDIEAFSNEEINSFGDNFIKKTDELTSKAKNILKTKYLLGK